MTGFDALALDVDTPVKMPLVDPFGVELKDQDGEAAYIEVLSNDSSVAVSRRKNAKKRVIEQAQKRKKLNYSAEQIEEDDVSMLVDLTKGWRLVDPSSKSLLTVEFNEKNARILYTDSRFSWIREQVEEFIADRSNFTNR